MSWTKNSSIVDDNCDGCGICERICPVNNVVLEKRKPQWIDKCESCLACFHWCPKRAIQINAKTKVRPRYHHPDITMKEIIGK